MNGSARGTALVALVLAVPVLCASMIAVAGGSLRAVVIWLGATAYLLYNSVMFIFATPFNRLFLLHADDVRAVDLDGGYRPDSNRRPSIRRALLEGAAHQSDRRLRGGDCHPLNALVWLMQVIPAILSKSPAFLEGKGLTTNPVLVQDLSFWIPLTVMSAAWIWGRRPWGYVIVRSVLDHGRDRRRRDRCRPGLRPCR